MPKIMFMETKNKANPKILVENCYGIIKELAKQGNLKSEDVAAIAELTTELANRLKVEESCGE